MRRFINIVNEGLFDRFKRNKRNKPIDPRALSGEIGDMLHDSVKPFQASYDKTTSSWSIIDTFHDDAVVESGLQVSEVAIEKMVADYNRKYFRGEQGT
jgi:hypothetical protein